MSSRSRAVAPVKSRVPRLPCPLRVWPRNAVIASRERECRFDVRVRHKVDFIFSYLQRWLPDGEARVEERNADVGVRPARTHGAESGLDFVIVVVVYWECRRLIHREQRERWSTVVAAQCAHLRRFPLSLARLRTCGGVALSLDHCSVIPRPSKETAGVPVSLMLTNEAGGSKQGGTYRDADLPPVPATLMTR